ncbi:MAG: hypothetical protein K0B06_05190 [Brevefilum sp.]|nr:hypothetical protein [Brevefilum sp.]
MNYGKILEKAWKIIWKHKILWLFGVLAGCSATGTRGGGGGGSAGGGGGANTTVQPGSLDFLAPSTQQALNNFGQFIASIPIWVWVLLVMVLVLVGLVLSIVFLLVGTLGETGVISGTGLADEADLDSPPLSFGTIFNKLKPHYWKVVLLRVGLHLVGFFVLLILLIPILLLISCTCCLGLFLLIPIGWLIETLVNFTMIAIIEEKLGIFPAIARAWQVITRNLGHVVVMFLILGVGGLIVGLIISLPLIIIPVPLVANLLISGGRMISVGLVLSLLLSMAFIPLLIFLAGVLRAYILASWTLTFRQLTLEGGLMPTVLNDEVGQD